MRQLYCIRRPRRMQSTLPRRESFMGVTLRWLIAIFIFTAGIIWVHDYLGWPQVITAWQSLEASTLALLLALTFASYGLRARRISRALPGTQNYAFSIYLRISLLHNALNNLLPMRLGEASLPIMAKRELGLSVVQSTTTLLLLRLMDLHFLLLVLCVSLLPVSLSVGTLGAAALLMVALLWRRLMSVVTAIVPQSRQAQLQAVLKHHQKRKLMLELYAYTALVWLGKLSALALIVLSFLDIPLYQGLVAVISADLSSVLPIHGLAGSGTFESAILIALTPFQLDTKEILSAAINVHLYVLFSSCIGAVMALLIKGHRHRTALSTP